MSQVQLILQRSVPNLGEAGDLVLVKPGYARNYLVPQGLAIVASAGRLRELEHQKRVVAEVVARQLTDLNATREKLAEVVLEVEAQAGESGRLFGSVTAPQIAALLAERGFEVDRRRVTLAEPIKALGEYKVPVRLHREVIGEVTVVVRAATAVEAPREDAHDDDEDLASGPGRDAEDDDDRDRFGDGRLDS